MFSNSSYIGAHRGLSPARFLTLASIALTLHAQTPVNFDREVRPILSNNCFRCHGPDESSRIGGFRLDLREEATKPQILGTPIVPGQPDRSELLSRIFSPDANALMPPVASNNKLTDAQKTTLRRWIAEGAKYESHWSYQPIVKPPVPKSGHPIDAFIQQRLAKENLKPAPEADRRTLIRRVTLDLTGLLPKPEEVAAFIADRSPDAYEKLVDRLLASPEYAEQQTVLWLDAVRYADSAGFHSDGTRPVWLYRDYVLKAFRDNKPFSDFTREQLAGDLLPNATVDQKIAAAYNRLSRSSAEGGLQPKEYYAKYGADRVRDLSTVWLGTSMGCAECHNHKFDPVLTKDFYALKAFFADIKEDGLIQDVGPTAFQPKMLVYSPGQKEAIDAAQAQVDAAKKVLNQRAGSFVDQQRQWEKEELVRYMSGDLAWQFPVPVAASATKAFLTIQKEPIKQDPRTLSTSVSMGVGMISVDGPNPDNETYTVTIQPGAGKWAGLGIETGQDDSLAGANIARGSERFIVTEVDAESAGKQLPFSFTFSDVAPIPGFPAMAVIDGDPQTGWAIGGVARGPRTMLMLRFATPVVTEPDTKITIKIHQDSDDRKATLGRFRIALAPNSGTWPGTGGRNAIRTAIARLDPKPAAPATAAGLDTPVVAPPPPQHDGLAANLASALFLSPDKRSENQKNLVLDYFEYSNPELQPARIELAQLEAKASLLIAKVPEVMITESVEPREVRILPRGNWMDETGDVVQPAIPEFLGKLETGGKRATRLDLANWLVSPSNPLTARVFVNRMWRQFFGTGLSKNLEDLGSQGEAPVYPELLDWLAADFMNGWDVKHLLRTIVTSATYKQSSIATDDRDPENRLLSRQSRFRIEAESVRDTALEISGLLIQQFGGQSVKPYEPEGYLAALNFPKREWSASHGNDLYRRAVYTHWQRTFLHPSLLNFDAPTREECTVNRINSNTPLQALDLLNDPIFVEAARVFAENILDKGGKTEDARLTWAFERSLERAPSESELKVLRDLHKDAAIHFETDKKGAKALLEIGEAPVPETMNESDLAAMTTVARVILNLHEAITRD